jgi:hypothetical protein
MVAEWSDEWSDVLSVKRSDRWQVERSDVLSF